MQGTPFGIKDAHQVAAPKFIPDFAKIPHVAFNCETTGFVTAYCRCIEIKDMQAYPVQAELVKGNFKQLICDDLAKSLSTVTWLSNQHFRNSRRTVAQVDVI